MALLGAAIGSLTAGKISDTWGRKPTIIVGDLFMTLGSFLMAFTPSIPILVLGRFMAGVGFGMEIMACNVYLSEVSPSQIRGGIIAINLSCCVGGQLFALLVCIALGN
eukprot:CAMPEP_0176345954 /NCGR_PEP_ID=MMETSP0126-20121128/5861_1 /TAXON_ID=141414 ORGANISM="Strombidinopsis acuminatum, Strain SPMC142" /NCGR_SAMPLE_ID=MMETSP0126 /ASSEMBLY_ACC=CAM_ASM_000229 /LENGTH=107 /DNA_ID=CAMNT_0017693221 /DNA_START=152 /DNA_END=475 /DNA_ORIENTATION=+